MVGIWLSVMATIVTVSVMTGFLADHERFVRGTTSDVVVTPRARRGDDGAIVPPAGFAAIRGALADVAGIGAMSPRIVRPALVRIDGVPSVILGDRKYAEHNFV